MAPQVGFEPTTIRVTAEPLAGASRCKHETYADKMLIIPLIGGDYGGTPTVARRRSRRYPANRAAFSPTSRANTNAKTESVEGADKQSAEGADKQR